MKACATWFWSLNDIFIIVSSLFLSSSVFSLPGVLCLDKHEESGREIMTMPRRC